VGGSRSAGLVGLFPAARGEYPPGASWFRPLPGSHPRFCAGLSEPVQGKPVDNIAGSFFRRTVRREKTPTAPIGDRVFAGFVYCELVDLFPTPDFMESDE